MKTDSRRRNFIVLNVLGGILVLASYAWGALAAPETMGSLWGGVPVGIRPIYTVNMLLSATGFFFFAPYIALRVEADRTDSPQRREDRLQRDHRRPLQLSVFA